MVRSFRVPAAETAVRCRRGVLNTELIIAAGVLGMAMAILLPGLSAAARVRQQREFEVLARLELNNLRLTAAGETRQLSGWFRSRYPDAELSESAVGALESWPAGEGVRLSISRPEANRGRTAAVTLVCWPGVAEPAAVEPAAVGATAAAGAAP